MDVLVLADTKDLNRITDVADKQRLATGRADERQPRHVAGRKEAALNRRDLHEVALPIAFQPYTVAGVRPRRVRLGIIEITGEDQVEITIAVHIVGDDSPNGRDLREVRQNMRAEPASSF